MKRQRPLILLVAIALLAAAAMSAYGCARRNDPPLDTSAAETTAPTESETTPEETTTPIESGIDPAESTTPEETTAPVEAETTPAETTAPVEPETTPAETTAPIEPETTPAETTAPVEPETTPAETTTPIEPETTPAETTAPIEPETTPAETTAPIEPETTPSETTAPIEPETTPAETAHEHDFRLERVIDPTCTESGYTLLGCSCGAKKPVDETAALGHSFGDWYTSTPVGCTSDGIDTRRCTGCGMYESKTVAKLGHSFGEWHVSTPASCSAEGIEIRECSGCGKTETNTLTKLDHSYGEWHVSTPASCTSEGIEIRECSGCGKTETQALTKLDHSFGEWHVTTPASCSAEGIEIRECSGCGKTETNAMPTIDHTFTVTVEPNYDPFSDDFGSNGKEVCTGCGAENVIEYTEPTYASDEYLRLLEQRILYWVNVYRVEEGVAPAEMLPRMWEYAQVRATYLTDNFGHDQNDINAAATEAKYGVYIISPSSEEYRTTLKYLDGSDVLVGSEIRQGVTVAVPDPNGHTTTGITGIGSDWEGKVQIPEGYTVGYQPACGEACGYANNMSGVNEHNKINNIAKIFANGVRNSPGHWSYVGTEKYITVGVAALTDRNNRAVRTSVVYCTSNKLRCEG